MGMNIYIYAIVGFKISGEQFERTKPAITEMKPAFNPDTGERLPDKEIILKPAEQYFVSPDGQEFDEFEELVDAMSATYPNLNVVSKIEWDYNKKKNDETLYIGPMLPGAKSRKENGYLNVYGEEQELAISDLMVLDEIKKMLEDMNIKLDPAKLHIISHVSC